MKSYLVTGGAGFIGTKLIEKLILSNKKITIISLDNYYSGKKSNHINHKNVRYVRGNTKNINTIFKNKKIDVVFHFC